MNRQEIRKQSVAVGLYNIKLPVILDLAGLRRRSLVRQRCIVPKKIDINDRAIPDYLFDDAFPRFGFSEKNTGIDDIAADFKTAITINPGDKAAYYAIGVLYYLQYEKDKTTDLLDTAIEAFEHIKGYKDKEVNGILEHLKDLKEQ